MHIVFFLLLSLICNFYFPPILGTDSLYKISSSSYPNIRSNPYLTKKMKKAIKPYLLPVSHPFKPALDSLCSHLRITRDEATLQQAGFSILSCVHSTSFVRVASHPAFPGYLFKIYPDNETRRKKGKPGWKCLLNRCKSAENIRKLIKTKKFRYFSVPDKWLYPLPPEPSPGIIRQPLLLVVTDMELTSLAECERAWAQATPEILDELYCILSHGYSSTCLIHNIPYTKSGKFACIDTESPKRKLDYLAINSFLSEAMRIYWTELVRQGENP